MSAGKWRWEKLAMPPEAPKNIQRYGARKYANDIQLKRGEFNIGPCVSHEAIGVFVPFFAVAITFENNVFAAATKPQFKAHATLEEAQKAAEAAWDFFFELALKFQDDNRESLVTLS